MRCDAGVLYRGYERKYFWWELVVSARKVAMVLIAVMLEEWGQECKHWPRCSCRSPW